VYGVALNGVCGRATDPGAFLLAESRPLVGGSVTIEADMKQQRIAIGFSRRSLRPACFRHGNGVRVTRFFAVSLCAAVLVVAFAACSDSGRTTDDRYYRAVYVLQSLGGPAAAEPEDIPPRIAYADETESLLHHQDIAFVLRQLADEFSALAPDYAKAQLYEAFARLALGEYRKAAELLSGYVVERPYQPEHYAILAYTLYSLEDYTTLLIICREWAERAPGCRVDRARHIFAALYNQKRFDEAMRSVDASEGRCLGWEGPVYAAKAEIALGDEASARAILDRGYARYPENAGMMRRLWDIIRERPRL
jgi:tetratricopeptide (TPR) repeat protein